MGERGSNVPQVGVGAVVFKDQKVLLVKRGRPPSKGLWAIPGGRLELGESLQQAAEREILEETGVVIRATQPLFTFDIVERDNTGNVVFHYVIVDLDAEYVSGEPHPQSDADDARWLSADDLQNLPVSRPTRELLENHFHFNTERV